ncbi:MAG: hypothetical protein ABSF52_09620 [Syntrophobacteraceae bacterium]|jgi:hypothetical protein
MWHANARDLASYVTDHLGDARLSELSSVIDCGRGCLLRPIFIGLCKGPLTIATLNSGQIVSPAQEVFDSAWLPAGFAPIRSRLWELNIAAKDAAKKPWADLDPGIARTIAQQVTRRIISSVRNSGHGGTILVIPPDMVEQVIEENPYLNIEYRVTDEATRKRFQTLLVNLLGAVRNKHHGFLIGIDL